MAPQGNVGAERPLLLLPRSAPAARATKGGGGAGPARLGAGRQQERIGLRLEELEAAFAAKRIQVQTGATGATPEDVLVLETAGAVDDFLKAVARVSGLEFLGEYDEEDIPPDDDFFVLKKKAERAAYTGRVYLVFANQDAFRQLLRLWQVWQKGGKFARGLAKWREVFELLRDIRPWGVKDRLEETGILRDWEERVARGDGDDVPCEIELWFRAAREKRSAAARRVREHVEAIGGTVLTEAVVEGIHYHGLAVILPAAEVARLLDARTRNDVQLVQIEQIQFLRASGQVAGRVVGERLAADLTFTGLAPKNGPVVALLDGLPLQKHRALDDRLTIDDPDDFETDYHASARVHGTAMASLIVWGDLNAGARVPIPQPLYVRPIMRPASRSSASPEAGTVEQLPDDVLVVDLVHRAVRRLFERDGTTPAIAPSVAVINLSIGIRDRPFEGTLSPLARLLDWLAWKYRVLFVVSAGNQLGAIEMGEPWSELCGLASDQLGNRLVRAVAADTRNRRILSPAEAMNVLTVGALHADDDTAALAGNRLDPLPLGYPSPINGHGAGYRRSVKPDLLAPGGRVQFIRPFLQDHTSLELVAVPSSSPGQAVAAPGSGAGDLGHISSSRGTSNAAALVSRASAFLKPALDEVRAQDGGTLIDGVPDALLLKTLLIHGARWDRLGDDLLGLFQTPENTRKVKEQLARLLGFGAIEIMGIDECSATRVTAIGGGAIARDRGVEHRFPLPPSLAGKRGWRRLTVSLAWFTPVTPLNHRWRQAHLWFEMPRSKLKDVMPRAGVDWQASQRGTVQHDTFEGQDAAAFVDGDDVVILVSCREDATGLVATVPYGLAVTLEVAESLGIDVYAEVRDRVRARVAAGRVRGH